MTTHDHPLGDVDGEPVEVVTLQLTGPAAWFDRYIAEGERVVIIAEGEMQVPKFKRVGGVLVRIQPIKVDKVGEPDEEDIAESAAEFLAELDRRRDEAEGRPQLPLENDEDE